MYRSSQDLVQVEVRRELHVDRGERVDGDDGDARLNRDQPVISRVPGPFPVPDGAVEAVDRILLVKKSSSGFKNGVEENISPKEHSP